MEKRKKNAGVEDKNEKLKNVFLVFGTRTKNPKSFTAVWHWENQAFLLGIILEREFQLMSAERRKGWRERMEEWMEDKFYDKIEDRVEVRVEDRVNDRNKDMAEDRAKDRVEDSVTNRVKDRDEDKVKNRV